MFHCLNTLPSFKPKNGNFDSNRFFALTSCLLERLWCLPDLPYLILSLWVVLACQEGVHTFDQCGQRCTCVGGRLVNCVRIRKEFTTMTIAERSLYVSVIKTASTDPRFKPAYDTLLNEHRRLFQTGLLFRIFLQ